MRELERVMVMHQEDTLISTQTAQAYTIHNTHLRIHTQLLPFHV